MSFARRALTLAAFGYRSRVGSIITACLLKGKDYSSIVPFACLVDHSSAGALLALFIYSGYFDCNVLYDNRSSARCASFLV